MGVVLKKGPDLLALSMITRRLRQADVDECFALSHDDDPDTLAIQTYSAGAFQWVAWCDGVPVASIGAHLNWPGVWTCWAFGTDDWHKVALTLTKHVLRHMIPALYEVGAQRVQCHASASHQVSRRWLAHMGAKRSKPLDFYGKNGQTYYCYWWDRRSAENHARRHLPAKSVSPMQT